nr:uncharacterized protein LOC104112307 [Nicotiana tomentosiformis]
MKINFDSGDGESEEDRRGCTKVEENLSNGADQVVDKNPQQNTNEQLIRFAPMIMDLFATLVPGFLIKLGGSLVSWKSKKQTIISRSSADAEYKSLAATIAELVWLVRLIKEIGIEV